MGNVGKYAELLYTTLKLHFVHANVNEWDWSKFIPLKNMRSVEAHGRYMLADNGERFVHFPGPLCFLLHAFFAYHICYRFYRMPRSLWYFLNVQNRTQNLPDGRVTNCIPGLTRISHLQFIIFYKNVVQS